MNSPSFQHIFFLFCLILVVGCGREYTPKPKAYPRMVLPQKAYQTIDNQGCPFSFEIPVYSNINYTPDLKKINEEDNCWMDVVFDSLNATFHISYKQINNQVKLKTLIEDAHKLTSKHIKKAEFIDQRRIETNKNVYGLFSDVGGNAASSMQFFLTDSVNHYLFGSLYFSSTPNYDSIQPAIHFLKDDMLHLIESFEWNEDYTATASR